MVLISIREPAAIGFYPGTKTQLLKVIEDSFKSSYGPGKLPEKDGIKDNIVIMGGISPHAGYIYSGPIAANLFYELSKQKKPETVIILGPSHGGYPSVAIMGEGIWRTPLGDIKIDSYLVDKIKQAVGQDEKGYKYIVEDEWPHIREHSIEVQIPFLQYIYGSKFKLVPIILGGITLTRCTEIGAKLSKIITEIKDKTIIIASTDMTHYGSLYYGFAPVGDSDINKILSWMKKTDGEIIKAIEELQPEVIYEKAEKTTMCGFIPISLMTSIAKALKVSEVNTLKYATSYDVKGSRDAIVGYLSSMFKY